MLRVHDPKQQLLLLELASLFDAPPLDVANIPNAGDITACVYLMHDPTILYVTVLTSTPLLPTLPTKWAAGCVHIY